MRNPLTRLIRRTSPAPAPAAPVERGRLSRAGDRAVLAVAVLVMAAVAAAAGYISFRHFVSLAISLGEAPSEAFLYPAVAEGMIIMASLVMLYCSRRSVSVPWLAWVCLAFGVAVAIGVNVQHGLDRSRGAALLAALAPIAFLASYEMLMRLIRLVRQAATPAPEPEPHVCPEPERVEVPVEVERVVEVPVERLVERVVERPVERTVETVIERPVPVVPTDHLDAARIAYEHSLTGPGRPIGQRRLAALFNITATAAKEIIETVQAAREQTPDTGLDEAPAVTVSDGPSEPAQDRHATAEEAPAEAAADTPAETPAVTVPEAADEPAQDRHDTGPAEPANEPKPETGRPAETADSVTVSETAENRHDTADESPAEAPSGTPGDEPAVTVPDGPEMAALVPSQPIPPDAPTRLLTGPFDEPLVTAPNGSRSTVTPTDESEA